jgi:hypothetical protein
LEKLNGQRTPRVEKPLGRNEPSAEPIITESAPALVQAG